MSALAALGDDLAAARAALHVLKPITFVGWYLRPRTAMSHETPFVALEADDLDAAAALMARSNKETFVIKETDELTGRAKLHFFIVKAKRVQRYAHYRTRVVDVPYAEHRGTLSVDAFEPRRPYDCFQDDRLTGRQPGDATVVELRG